MTPSSGPTRHSPPAMPAISSADLAAWLERRRRFRRKVIAAVIVLLSVGVAAFAAYWTAFNRHLVAMSHLRGRDFMVDWDISLENFRTGGDTSVAFRGNYSWHGWQVTGEDLQSLKRLNHLQSLELSGLTALRDGDLSVIEDLHELQELDLSRQPPDGMSGGVVIPLGDDVLAHVKGLSRLKSLGLAGNRITDAGLAKLANLQSLEMLDLDGTLVTNAGLDALVGLKALKSLRVENTRVTRKGAARFQQKRPDVEVIRESEIIGDPGTPVQ